MKFRTKWTPWVLTAVAAVILALATAAVYPQVSQAAGKAPGTGFGMFGRWGMNTTHNSALANALGVSTDQLQAAQDKVFADNLKQAVTDGRLTQAQADQMLTRRKLQAYLAPKLQTAYQDAIKQAVTDGIITQAQADKILSGDLQGVFGTGMGGPGMMDRGRFGNGEFGRGNFGRGAFGQGFRRPGGRGGRFQTPPAQATPQSNSYHNGSTAPAVIF